MCGILGVRRSWRSWRSDRGVAEAALDSLAWRGPDGRRLIEAGDWILGAARLWITDRDAAQPLSCPETGRAVVFNGAVTSAAREWRRWHGVARTRNDAELLLLRLRDGGAATLGDASGPFAFAVVDPATDVLWLGRDPAGEKPLFVVRDHGRVVAFASSVAALWRLGVAAELGVADRAQLLRFGFAPPPGGSTADDLELRSDLHGVWAASGVTLRRVAAPVPSVVLEHDPRDLRGALEGAVARCASAEVELGACVSGGVDSACIALCLDALGRRLPAYQFRADGEPDSEPRVAQRVAAACGLRLREVGGGPELLRALPELTRMTGAPLGDPSVLAVHALARAAARDGVRVLLSGEGSDDLLLGYPRHRAARYLPRRGFGLPVGSGLSRSRAARLGRALGDERPYAALLEVAPRGFRSKAYEPPFDRGRLPPRPAAAGAAAADTVLDDARYVDRHHYLRDDLLPKLDVALMAAGIEGRCPFLDAAVVHSAAAREPDARRVVGKRALRRAFARRLPPGILGQRKRGFSIPLDRWLREDDFLADVLTDRRTLERPHVRPVGLRDLLDRHRSGRADLGQALYATVALELYDRAREEVLTPCG